MTKINVVIADGTVTVDGDTRRVDMNSAGIQAILKKDPSIHAITWDGGGGHVQRQGLSGYVYDKNLIKPFQDAYKVAKAADDQAAKAKAAKDKKEAADLKKKEEAEIKALEDARQARLKELALAAARNKAQNLLADSDIIVVRLAELGKEVPLAWRAYREKLREIARKAPPNEDKVNWPEPPPKPKELT